MVNTDQKENKVKKEKKGRVTMHIAVIILAQMGANLSCFVFLPPDHMSAD